MQRASENKPLDFDWDGKQSRDFIHVQDALQAILLAARQAIPGETYNVASGHTCTLLQLADTLEKVSGRKLARIFHPKRPGDVHESSADIHKIRALGFEPEISLEKGLAHMWAHLKQQV